MEIKWFKFYVPQIYAPTFNVRDHAVLVTAIDGKLQATEVEVQTRLDPDREGRRIYTGKTLDSLVRPEGSTVEFTSEHANKQIS